MKAIATIAAAIALAASTSVIAAPASLSVQTADLDLATDSGRKTLALRIYRAARELCASEAVRQSPKMFRAERQCVKATKKSVEEQIAARTTVRTASE
jgi:UrcA family protein